MERDDNAACKAEPVDQAAFDPVLRSPRRSDEDGVRIPSPIDADGRPIGEDEAHAFFRPMIGVAGPGAFTQAADRYWDRLLRAATPEEKLGCERLIRAAYVAQGMGRHHRGAVLERENWARVEREAKAKAEAMALARWF